MSTEVKERVVTEFEIADKASAPLGQMQSVMQGLGGIIQNTVGHIFNLKTAIGSLVGGLVLGKIAQIGSDFENVQIQMAGFFQVQHAAKSFAEGLGMAQQAMVDINLAAAILPGETEEYTSVFLQSFANVHAAMQGSVQDTYEFTNKMTALGKAFKLDAGEIGRQLTELLTPGRGRAAAHNILWQRMLSSLHQVKGASDLTAESFNKLTAAKRFELLSATVGQFDDTIKAASNTWEAQAGTFKSDIKMITRLASASMFSGMKDGLGSINALMVDDKGHLTAMSQGIVTLASSFTNHLSEAIKGTIGWFGRMHDRFDSFTNSPGFKAMAGHWANAKGGLLAIGDSMKGHGVGLTGAAVTARVAGVAGGMAGVPWIAPIIMGLTNFATRTNAVTDLLGTMGTTLDILIGPLVHLGAFSDALSNRFGDLMEGVLNPLFTALNSLLRPIMWVAGGLMHTATVILTAIGPSLMKLWGALGQLLMAWGGFWGNIFKIVGGALNWLVSVIGTAVVPIFNLFVSTVSWGIKKLAEAFAFIGRLIGKVAPDVPATPGEQRTATDDYLAKIRNSRYDAMTKGGIGDNSADKEAYFRELLQKKFGADSAKAAQARGGGGRAVQDFRYSKFEIQQKFAEGYDPDRVAVAFARDVGKIGEMKLQSAHEPLFSTH